MGGIEPDTRVCPRCGEPAGEQRFCGECGLSLASQPEIPTRRHWEAHPEDQPSPISQVIRSVRSHPSERDASRSNSLRGSPARVLIAAGVAVIAVVLILVLVAGGGDYGCRDDVEATVANQMPGLLSEGEIDSLVDTCVELRKECEDSGQSNCDAAF